MGKLYLGEEEVNFAVNDGGVDTESNIMFGVSGNSLTRTNTKFKLPEGATRFPANAFAFIFYNTPSIVEADLSTLENIAGTGAMQYAFANCLNIEKVNLSNLSSVTGSNAFNSCFSSSPKITELRFDSLSTLTGGTAFNAAFASMAGLTDVYFPALNSNSFSTGISQFNNCNKNNDGVTFHFPASVRSKIEGMQGYPNFGGTNTVIAFDL